MASFYKVLKMCVPYNEGNVLSEEGINPIESVKDKAVPLQDWTGPEVSRKLRFPNYMTTAQDGGRVVSLAHRPPLPPGNTPGSHSYYRKDFMSMKTPLIPAGIEPVTFLFVAQHLNHCATAVDFSDVYR